MRDTHAVGVKTEGIVLAALLKNDYRVLLPFGEGHRYDLAFDVDGKLNRVQCRTGSLVNGVIWFRTGSYKGVGKPVDYRLDAEFFGVYCPQTDEAYLVPVNDVPLKQASLRVEPLKSNQKKNVRWAQDYKILGVLAQLVARLHGMEKVRGRLP